MTKVEKKCWKKKYSVSIWQLIFNLFTLFFKIWFGTIKSKKEMFLFGYLLSRSSLFKWWKGCVTNCQEKPKQNNSALYSEGREVKVLKTSRLGNASQAVAVSQVALSSISQLLRVCKQFFQRYQILKLNNIHSGIFRLIFGLNCYFEFGSPCWEKQLPF